MAVAALALTQRKRFIKKAEKLTREALASCRLVVIGLKTAVVPAGRE